MFGSLPGDGAAPVDCDSASGFGAVTADSISALSLDDPPLKIMNATTTAMISSTIFMSLYRKWPTTL